MVMIYWLCINIYDTDMYKCLIKVQKESIKRQNQKFDSLNLTKKLNILK